MLKSAIYYTANTLDEKIMIPCQKQMTKAFQGEIVSVSLEPIDFGRNYVFNEQPGYLTMFRQILLALEKSKGDVIYFLENDVLYHKSHFDFTPLKENRYYYNLNSWWLRYEDGHTLWLNNRKSVSGLCGYREQLIKHYKERIRRIEIEGFTRRNGFEPGTRHISHGGYDNNGFDTWTSEHPNIDIRHNSNLSNRTDNPNYRNWRWKPQDYKNKKYIEGWTEGDESIIPGWNIAKGQFKEFLSSI